MNGKANKRNLGDHRRALLAKVHIAIKDLDMDDADYRDILDREFGVKSARHLSNRELADLVGYFESKGWASRQKGKRGQTRRQGYGGPAQAEVLKEKARNMLDRVVDDGLVGNPRGLVRKICGVDDLDWCGEAVRLKRLLAVLGSIAERGSGSHGS